MGEIPDISTVHGLQPKTKFFPSVGEEMLNVDACIEICRRIDTPQAKAIYHAFRRALAQCRSSMKGQKPEKIREEAWFKGLEALGYRINLVPMEGTMD